MTVRKSPQSPQSPPTTILEIGSCLPLNWRWRNGGTGWRELNTPLRSSLTTKTWNISEVPRGYAPDEPSSPEPILPPAVLVSPIRWALDEKICIASITEPAPLGGPEVKTYVPPSLRTTLLGSLHASPGSGHPGSKRTLSLLQARYWWPSIARDVSQYIRGCSVCTISKSPHHSDKPLETFPFPTCLPGHSAHLIPLCCYSINLLFVLKLPLCPVSIC